MPSVTTMSLRESQSGCKFAVIATGRTMANYLTKSRYLAGLQCQRRLWLLDRLPREEAEPAPGSPLQVGIEIGRKARLLFPGGVLVAQEPWKHEEAVARTAALMRDPSVPAIFEAAFTARPSSRLADGHEVASSSEFRLRVDVLERQEDGWGLVEVKSGTGVKPHHLEDIVFQSKVLAEARVHVNSITVVHVDNSYIRGAGEIEWTAFFSRVDVAAIVQRLRPDVRPLLQVLGRDEEPAVAPGRQCSTPYVCEFWDRCTADKPLDWVFHMPRLTAAQEQNLAVLGIDRISAIPPDFGLTANQSTIRAVVISGVPSVAPDLARLLRPFGPPACYLDFEAMMPAVPLYEGTRPYQALPFQWSLHEMAADGGLTHRAFLADAGRDPRRPFAVSLIEALADSDLPIIVYSPYEMTRLRELAAQFPDLAPALDAVMAKLVDLLPVVRGGICHPASPYGNSIKTIAPALKPGFGYDDLTDVADGGAAAAAFGQLAAGAISDPEEIAQMRASLLAYCERDTLAMVEVHRALINLSGGRAGGAH